MFALHPCVPMRGTQPPFPDQQSVGLVNASSAIWLLVSLTKPSRVWLPSFLCRSIVDSVRRAGAEIEFYSVNRELRVAGRDWVEQLESSDLVLFIDYFGFPADREVVRTVQSAGVRTVRDASHALFSESDTHFDFTIYSLRKTVGVPDGGLLFYANDALDVGAMALEPPPAQWLADALLASVRRADFDINGGENDWYPLFRELEATAPIGPFRMSELSELLLRNCFDIEAIRQARRRNYATLAAGLPAVALFPKLPATVTPLGFPVRLMQRETVRERLIANRIYPPIHWPVDDVVPRTFSESHALSRSILTLPCDQRYDADDMQRIIAHVAEAAAA